MNVHRTRGTGFTMVEMVTVLTLLGIIMAAMGPRFVNMASFRQRGYADEVAGALRYSQRIAVASGCNVRFTVTSTDYRAFQRNALSTCTSSGTWTVKVLLPDGQELTGTTPSGVTISPATIEFSRTGNLVGAASTISVGSFSVAVDPVVGRVTVQ